MRNRDRDVVNLIFRTDFHAFLERCFRALNPGTPFQRNWHIEAIVWRLELVRLGKERRLIFNVPPRSLKSFACSVAFPAFVLGHDPTARIICVSYGSDLSTKFALDCRAILQSGWYRDLFPRMRISSSKNTETEILTTQYGYRLATSIGGSLTGRGGNYVIIDDPIKPQDALSDSRREYVNDWYANTLVSRLDDKRTAAVVVVMQRVHRDDLTGKLLRGSDKWTLLKLPAIAQEEERIQIGEDTYHCRKVGDLLHAEREPREVLNYMRAELGADNFAAQYLQDPVVPGGNMVKRNWVRRYDDLPTRTSSTYVLQSWDTASKSGEASHWSACSTWYVINKKYFLVDMLRQRLDYPTLKAQAIAHARFHNPTTILIEDTGVGPALVSELQNSGFRVVPMQVEQNKMARMSVQSGKFASGQVLLPHSATWLKDLEEELFSFPASRYDDQIDSISQALGYKISASAWTDEALEGFGRLAEGLVLDNYLAGMMGRPW
jgi:predicted phage terminase large subunit-like protein